ncbi:hypothetical protein B0H67DRAFT_480830 [Lasiosphaeris hirsuta]|uniref:DUF7907 domain-containing protein n=1 Tax=Lasiosphaeris hirsuta TaxID=260670 RepID=A0AA40E2C1_9PEZI|nr:hypothetical protein B0H67DRAFT_480830 [Lasiosphaeris hirsuta]
MTSENPTPPPPKAGQFFLKIEPLQGKEAGRFGGLYLRQYSVAHPAVLLTPGPPKFLRANMADTEAGAGVEFTSWAPHHAGRKWGLVLSNGGDGDSGSPAFWKPVEIAEDRSDKSLKGHSDEGWTGWMVSEWSLGYPQLFWTTHRLEGRELPAFCERVRIVREVIE